MASFVRFSADGGAARYGEVYGNRVMELEGDILNAHRWGGKEYDLQDLKVLPPCAPSKILAAAVNYELHAEEVNRETPAEPQLFLKPPSCLVADGEDVILPSASERVGYEGELAVIIKDTMRKVAPNETMKHVLGYTCGNDISARDWQKKDRQWWRAKGSDTFCPLGPYIVTDVDPHDLKLELYINGERRQSCNTGEMIHKIPQMLSFISGAMTLLPGDVLLTGTPGGVGILSPSDLMEVRIERVGVLRNRCVAERP